MVVVMLLLFPHGAGAEGSDSGTGKFSKHAKLPAKNPMVRQKSGGYYRVRILKEEATRVRIGEPLTIQITFVIAVNVA